MKTTFSSQALRKTAAGLLTGLIISGFGLTLQAAKGEKPSRPGKIPIYTVLVVGHPGIPFTKPTYAPSEGLACVAETGGQYTAFFPRHDLLATVVTDTGCVLTDDISIKVSTDKQGRIVSLFLCGQDVIGEEGIMHVSNEIVLPEPVIPSPDGFILHVDMDAVAIWKTDRHTLHRAKKIEIVGYISLGDMLYVPQP